MRGIVKGGAYVLAGVTADVLTLSWGTCDKESVGKEVKRGLRH